ncbi:MAG: DNA gyrase inhibitor YacG [Thiomonas sp. 20-64-9]|nr:MAG: DNA gyrase inhibitor YacG [Thiomonas sp. 20-64-9]
MDSTQAPASSRRVRCPHCGAFTVYSTSNPWRPFCSERCKSIDFGAWASESYRVQAKPEPTDFDDIDTTDPSAGPGSKPH